MDETTPSLTIVNRFPQDKPYLLGEELAKLGIRVIKHDFADIDRIPQPTTATLWRLSENLHPQYRHHLTKWEDAGHTLLNSSQTLETCANKLTTYNILHKANLPTVPTAPANPGTPIPANQIAKPAFGAGGRDITYGPSIIPTNTLEPWIVQPIIGNHAEHLRILVINNKIVAAYKRIPAPNSPVNNIDAGGYREFITPTPEQQTLALAATREVNAFIAGIDLTDDPTQVLEINGTPGIPPEYLPSIAQHIATHLHNK